MSSNTRLVVALASSLAAGLEAEAGVDLSDTGSVAAPGENTHVIPGRITTNFNGLITREDYH